MTMHLFKLTDEQLTQMLIPERFVKFTPTEHECKNMIYVFNKDDSFNLTYDELVEIVRKARQAGPRMIPVLGTVN